MIEKTKGIEKPIYINSTPEGIFAFKLDEIANAVGSESQKPCYNLLGKWSRVPKEVTYLETSKGKTL